jgi:uncharacterized protein YndB with AHSA1/START domain
MSQKTLSFVARFDVSPEALWAVIIDHEGMSDWLDAKIRVIAGRGDGGVGTVRRIQLGPLSIDEEVTLADAPRLLVYRIIRGLPLRFHKGEMRVAPHGDGGSELSWTITIASGVPLFAETVAASLTPAINRGLRRLSWRLG